MKKFYTKVCLFIFSILLCASFNLNAAPLHDVPQTLTQPDGSVLHCFASGDEYYNWLHDKDGYTIVADPVTGYYVYADKSNRELIPSKYIVGTVEPKTLGIEKWLKIAPEKIYEKVKAFQKAAQEPGGKKEKSETIQVTGTINNLVIFIRFSDESEFTDPTTTYSNMFNANGSSSLKSYYLEASYNQVTVSSTFYPTPGATVLSYQDSHVRNYYKPYHVVNNPTGYQTDSARTYREHTLLKNAINAVKSQVPPGLNIDSDGNGFVDNVCFIIYGAPGGWSDLLWPHQWSLFSYNVQINSKVVWKYNLQLQTVVDVGVLSHEMFHTFGAPDLYHYGYDGKTPVGYWDLMEYDLNPPQHMGAYMKYKYGNWITSIPLISSSGTYQLNPLTTSYNNCYRINSPFSATEYFIVEYRRKTGTFESSVPGSGLLVYRINSTVNGNQDGPPDEVYVYRLDGTPTNNGNINQAHFSSDAGRTAINDLTNPSCFLTNGSDGGLILYDVGSVGSTISFKIGFGVMPPVLKLPVNNADGLNTNPLLVWYKSTDALTYDLQVSTMPDLSTPVINLTGLTDTTYQVPSPLSNGIRYYWRIKVHTAIDTSEWSSVWNFRIILGSPTLVSPVNNSHSQDTALILSWSAPFGADTYGLQVASDSLFTNIIYNFTNITGQTKEIAGLNHSFRYYWHVNASNAGGTGQWSDFWYFNTTIGPPALASPFNHQKRVSDSGYVSWNKNPIAVSYRVQISRFPDFSVNIYDQSNITDTFFLYRGFEFGTEYFWRVNASSDYDMSDWSSPWDFTTILASPILLSPSNHESGVPETVSFHWLSVNQALTFNIQSSTDSTFNSDTLNRTDISGTSIILGGFNNNTKYFWRVSGHNMDGDGLWSSINDFVIQLAPPVLVSPNKDATVNPDSVSFNWNTVPGATSYKLLVSEEQNFSTLIINDSAITATIYNYNNLTKNQDYYWKVSAKSPFNTGEWSEIWKFSTSFESPVLEFPPNNESGIPLIVEFRWNVLSDANFYHIRVSTSQNFNIVLIDDSTLTLNNYNYSQLAKNTRYYWQVRAKKGSIWGNWSSVWNFSTSLSSPALSAPPDGNVFLKINGTLYWKSVNGASDYNIQISKSSDFNPVIINDFSNDSSFDYSNLEYNTKYYWRVAGKNSDGIGEWSEVWNFATRIATPTLLTPSQNTEKIQVSGKLLWLPVEGAKSYNVQLSEWNDFSNYVINDSNLENTSIYYTNLKPVTLHYWHVSAANIDGTTEWSGTWIFTTDSITYVDEQEKIDGLDVQSYPNPANESACLQIVTERDAHIEINLINLLGIKIKNIFKGILKQGINRIDLNTSAFPSAIYFVEITNGISTIRKTIIINR
ncbi:MAG: M6 family metalloprotease domain-containing protein [Bacteroidetes bacterium]|nr:MAG: M6 family metalloprotease domain-containing protein [Bacteroidota bacterium]